jgi:hypothetical protein
MSFPPAPTVDVMEPREQRDDTAELLALAHRLRSAAADAGRGDVAAKVDDAIALLTGRGRQETEADRGNTVVRILDGLGF